MAERWVQEVRRLAGKRVEVTLDDVGVSGVPITLVGILREAGEYGSVEIECDDGTVRYGRLALLIREL